MKAAVVSVLRAYKRWFSPALPVSCRYVPTCSEYAMDAVERHGVMRGLALAAWRILRCNPLGGSGYDPVPHEHSFERARFQSRHDSCDLSPASAAEGRTVRGPSL